MHDDIGTLGRWVLSVMSTRIAKTVLEIREDIITQLKRCPTVSGITSSLEMLEGHGFVESRERAISRHERLKRADQPLFEYILTAHGRKYLADHREPEVSRSKIIRLRPRLT